MRHNKFICAVTAIVMTLGVYQTAVPSPASTVSAAGAATVVRLDPSEASPFNDGKFEGWGTALCWWANRIGYDETLTQQAADAFFSDEGLGLDIARYNIGGGDDPAHTHITRSDSAVPGYWGSYTESEDGKDVTITYDWTKDENQRNVAKAALEANPNLYFEGFSNSAPYFMTTSGCTSGGNPASADNLKTDMYDDFAKYIAETTKHFKDDFGIEFKSYSPMNEPDTAYWGVNSDKQEGCHFDPGTSQSNMIIETRKALDAAGLNDVLVAGMDETDINKSVTNFGKLTDEAKTALGRIDTHTYNGSNRAGLKQTAMNANKNLWQSEVDGKWDGFGLAQRIIDDLNGMQASAWVMWNIVDSHKDSTTFEYPAGSGTHPEANNSLNVTGPLWGVGMADHDTKTLQLANKYYAYGQFTKYINPGDTLIASSNKTLAAYNKDTGAIKVVVNNSGSSDVPYEIDMSAFTSIGSVVTEIRSNNLTGTAAEHWKPIRGEAELQGKKLITTAKAGTITTYIIEREASQDNIIKSFTADENGLSYEYDLPLSLSGYDAYFAAYNTDGKLVYVSKNKPSDEVDGNFASCTHKLLVWDGMEPVSEPITYDPESGGDDDFTMDYAIISGGGNEIGVGASADLTLKTNIEGDVTWSISDPTLADIVPDGKTAVVTAKAAGSVTVYAEVGGFKVEKSFLIPSYKLSGTPSWGNASSAPADSADYRKAADGDLSTYFDGVANGWVMYDYGEPYKISEVKLAARSGDGMAARTVGAKVQGSNDAINWTDLYTIKTAIPADQYTTVAASELANNKAYRYYRYTNPSEMTNIAEFQLSGEASDDTPADDPVVTDIAAFTDDFENSASNIFNGTASGLADGNVIYASGLERFGNVFVPVNTTASSELDEAVTLGKNQLFRLQFNMFAGWEQNGKDNTFAIKDADGNEIVALYLTGGGYNVNQIRIGGQNVLASPTVAQSRSNAGTSGNKLGANGWGSEGQAYRNNMGYNKTCEILIDGAGSVSVSFTGGMEDTAVTGVLSSPISIKSIEATGAYAVAAGRVASYDNFDGDIITYKTEFAEPTPMPSPTPTPEPTDPPVLPEDGTLISLNFDNENLTSGSAYGKAEAVGTAKFATVDDKQVLQLDNTNTTVIKLTDANGNGLLAGQTEITVSFSVKPTVKDPTSWWFFAAPNADEQKYEQEHYIGALLNKDDGKFKVERYNGGTRAAANVGNITLNEWNDIIISLSENKTELYINGALASSVESSFKLTDILGNNPIAYIGRANWGTNGEFATGYIDDFKIVQGALSSSLDDINLGDLSAVKSDLTLPTNDGSITWESSDPDVISTEGAVTQPIDTTDVTLTAKVTENGIPFTRSFTATVIGLAASAETFTAYAEGTTIKYTSEYGEDDTFDLEVTLTGEDGAQIGVSKTDASGEFTELEEGTYKVNYILKDKTSGEVKKTVTKVVEIKDELQTAAYLFAHFVGNESSADHEQIYFSVSTDGTNWTVLNKKAPVLKSTVGTTGVRDPFIMRGEDGKFYIIATDLSIFELNKTQGSNRWGYSQRNGSRNIIIWESDDLVTWGDPRAVEVMPEGTGCVWAPEAVYDRENGKYMVFWASKTSADDYSTQRVYRSYTDDFQTFTEAEPYISESVSNIDTTIVEEKGVYYRFTKNESASTITMMKSNLLDGPWTHVSGYNLGNLTGYEGPTAYKTKDGKWTLMFDLYSGNKGYIPFTTDDISTGNFTQGTANFESGITYRHGSVMPITQEEYDALIAEYPNS